MSTTTNSGVAEEVTTKAALHFDSHEDAADVILKGWEDEDNESLSSTAEEKTEAPEPRQQDEEEGEADETVDTEETEADPEDGESEETEDQDESDTEEEEGSEEESEPKTLGEDAVVEVKVGDETLKVSVKDLTRLYGQEAALTKKSQQVAAKRKEVEQEQMKTAAVLDKMYQKAAERWKPFSEIDMLIASKQLDADQFTALRTEAQAAWEDFRFVSEEAEQFVKTTQAQQQEKLKEAASESVKVLKEKIPNWSNSLYDSIRDYAISNGMQAEVVNNLVDPIAIELIHKARLYDEGKKIATKKKVAQPKKVIKTTAMSNPKAMNTQSAEVAAKRLRDSGDVDDAANLFLNRWTQDN